MFLHSVWYENMNCVCCERERCIYKMWWMIRWFYCNMLTRFKDSILCYMLTGCVCVCHFVRNIITAVSNWTYWPMCDMCDCLYFCLSHNSIDVFVKPKEREAKYQMMDSLSREQEKNNEKNQPSEDINLN